MEIPCQLTFTGKQKHITTLKRFLDSHWFSYIDHSLKLTTTNKV